MDNVLLGLEGLKSQVFALRCECNLTFGSSFPFLCVQDIKTHYDTHKKRQRKIKTKDEIESQNV